jgi:hypothetical protein
LYREKKEKGEEYFIKKRNKNVQSKEKGMLYVEKRDE